MAGIVLFTEQYGTSQTVQYSRKDPLKIERTIPGSNIPRNVYSKIQNLFREILLPHGYPDSVSSDYFTYQIWDTLQAFCSTITGSFTTRAILKSVGVGDAEATALSATITWILKDGSGMIGRIIFAWAKGNKLDCDSKKWRLFADFLNDLAMAIELCIPYYVGRSMEVLCVTSTMKSIVGIAGGATRASITHHQAVNGNMADISAKDGTQETVVNLLASFASIYLLSIISDQRFELLFIFLLMLFHLFFNYKAVTCLIFDHLNESRMVLVVKSYCDFNTVFTPIPVNFSESVILGRGMKISDICGFQIKLGSSLSRAAELYNFVEMEILFELFKDKEYIIVSDVEKRCIYVALEKNCSSFSIIESYFHSVMLGLATCIYNNIPIDLEVKRQRNHSNMVARLQSFMANNKREYVNMRNMSVEELKSFNKFLTPELNMFMTSLEVNGWDLNLHSFGLDQWKINWRTFAEKQK